jgi:hypothetical protein
MTFRYGSLFIARAFTLSAFAVLAAHAFSAPRALSPSVQKPASFSAAQASDAAAMFLKLFDTLDADRDGVVLLADFFDTLNLQQAEARQVKRARGYDRNGDGKVTRDEAVAGVKAEIAYQTDRGMNTDADADGALTPQEYALSVPDPNGKADASGLTPMQQRGFREDDLSGDGRITRDEIETRVSRSYESNYWTLWMAVRARRADRNRDGAIDAGEFAPLEGLPAAAPLPEQTMKRFQQAGAKDGQLPVMNTQALFFRMNDAARAAAEKRMDAFEEKLKTAQAANQPEGIKQ